ncbi:hypothetical protein AV656_13660 [Bhargavaea cecembensis]|uniref:YsnF/AvaK domain-containing protein n=1 Tax=Bhargavaea cecembensis TaxID=394098 RepID=A0A165GL79_9BACL|nr:YsnF/AvaK domain-containing protein [Bhargavaea cecembensis]KZE36825.1 hypothetical protein AV656_13660 [Bhargavaea cecembensis]
MVNRKYIGTYRTEEEVMNKIEQLKTEGYDESSLYVVTNNSDNLNTLRGRMDVDARATDEDRGWLDRFMDFLGGDEANRGAFNDMGFTEEEANQYYNDARDGGILLFADADYGHAGGDMMNSTNVGHYDSGVVNEDGMTVDAPPLGEGRGETVGSGNYVESEHLHTHAHDHDHLHGEDHLHEDDETRRLRLHEEKLNVDKERVQTGEVDIDKHVVTDEQTVEVPVTREEVYVERRKVDGEMADGEVFEDEDSIRIPVTEEHVEVTKRPVVNEEIVVGKRQVQDTETVSETVRREEVDIDKTGDVHEGIGRAGGESRGLNEAAADFDLTDDEDLELRNRDVNNRDLNDRDRL